LQKDQYGRAVGEVKAPGMLWAKYVDQHLLKAGLAEVYRGAGAVYGHLGKDAYIQMEEHAKRNKKGMWCQGDDRESAAEYKARVKEES
jgi:endonuclease YncB( thermonuclease family)